MADDVINIRLQVDETTATQVQNRVQNIISKISSQSVKLRFEAININQINSQVDALQKKIKQLQGASINFNTNTGLTTEQQQFRLETQRLAVLQRIELAKERTAQSENQALAALAQENRTLTHTLNLNEQINGQVQHTHEHIRNINTNTRDFIDYLSDGVRYLLVYRTLYKVMNQISESFSEMKNVDKELISVRKTTGMSENEIDAIRKASYGVATEYGRTASEYLGSVSEFARGGYKELSTELAKVSLLTQNVGDVNSETADRMLLSIDAAYGLKGSVSELTNVVNGLNEVANLNPTSVAKLSDGMQVSASMAKVAGLEISDLVSLIGTATSVTQRDGAEVSRAIRTILMNIRQVKGELEDGTVIDGDSIAKAEAALEGVGIATKKVVNGTQELRDPMDILDELAGKWHTFNSEAQSVILESLANKRQANVLAAILENWDMVGKMQREYFNSANSAIEENELYLKGWEATSKKVTAKFTEYIANMADTSMIIDSLNTLYGALEALDTPVGRIATQIVLINTALAVTGRLWQAVRARSVVADILSLGIAERNLGTAIQLVSRHLWEQVTAWLATPFGQLTAAVTAATVVVKAYDKALSTTHETAQKNVSQADEQIKKYDSEISSLEELRSKLVETKGNKEALAAIQSDLNKEIGETPGLLNGESSAYETANKKIQSRIDLMKELKEEEQSRRIENSKEAFNSNFVDVFGLNESGDSIRKQVKEYSSLKNDENSIIGVGFKDSLDYINSFRLSHKISKEDWESYWNEQVKLAQDVFADTINNYSGAGGSNFLNLIIEDAVKSGDDLAQINEVIKEFTENKSLQDSVNKYWESLSNNTDSEKTLNAVSSELDKLKQKYPEVIDLVDKFYEIISKGKGDKSETVEDEKVKDAIPSIEELSKSLDNIQSAYKSVQSAIEEYNKTGILSVDTFQSLMELEPQYLNMLMDENGNLNLNTDAVNTNTDAYIENMGVKAALNLIDNVSKYEGEAAQLEYLTGVTNEATNATWELVNRRLEAAELVSDPTVMEALKNRIKAIQQMTEAAKAGIGKGGLGGISDTSKVGEKALKALQYRFDQLEQSIEKVDNALSMLNNTLGLQADDDYIGKLETVTRQLGLAQEKSSLLRDEFSQLANTQYNTADEANELAKRMESVADSIADNTKNIIGYGRSITEYYMSALSSIGSLSDATIERATSLFERNVKTLQEGGLTGLQFTLSPAVPQSAYEKQREENRAIEEEMRSYYDTLAVMQKIALDMQRQESQKASDNTQTLQKTTNKATSVEQKKDDDKKLTEQKSFISAMEENVVGLNNWTAANPIKAPELDTTWQQRVDEAKNYAQKVRDAFIGRDLYEGFGNGKGAEIARTAKQYLGVPYVWGGQSETNGWDCSGFVRNMMAKNGISVVGNTDAQWFGTQGTKVTNLSNLIPGDVLYFTKDGGKSIYHEAIYIGNNKMVHAKGTSYGTVEETISDTYKRRLVGAKRFFAKGTKDFAVYGDNINGVAGENYKSEILVDKKTGEMTTIDEPTFIDTGKYDVVGEKTTARVLNKYATGTPTTDSEILSYIKRASEETGVPANIIMAVMDQETGYKWYDSVPDGTAYSHGYMMLYDNGALAGMDAQRKQLAKTDKYTNVLEGAKLLASNYKNTGDWQTAIARYNGSGSAAEKYGREVWSRANSSSFIEAAKSLNSIASYTGSTADNILAIRESFDSQLQEWLNGGVSTSTSSITEEDLLSYIKENIDRGAYGNEEFIKKWDEFQAINNKSAEIFKELDKRLLESVGTKDYNAVKDEVLKTASEYTNTMMKTSAEANLAELKNQYNLNKAVADKMFAFYNQKKAEGATADDLTTIINSYNKQLERVQDISDKWVSAVQSVTDYLVSQDAAKLQAHDDRLSWIKKENEELTRQYENTNDAVNKAKIGEQIADNYKQIIAENTEKQNTAHQNVLDLYKNKDYMPIFERFDVEEWFDANGEATAKYKDELAALSTTDSELATIMTQVFAIIQQNKQAYYEAGDAIQSADDSLIEFNKTQSNLRVDKYIEYQKRLSEILDFQKSMNDAVTTGKQSLYDFMDTLREEQNTINTELQKSMQLDDWLTEDTRKRLFNLDDYSKETKVINDLYDKAKSLYADYQRDINALTEEEAWKQEGITAEYNKQIAALQDKLGIAKQELDVAKKQAALNNALKEQDVQVIMGNRVQNIADPERLSQLAEAKAQSELELDNLNIKSSENSDIRGMERISDKFAGSMSEISSRLEMLNSMPDETREKFADFLPPIEEIAAKVAVLAKADPWYMISENSSDTILKNLPWKKIIGFDLSYDYQEGIEQILRGYSNGTIEQSRALDLVVEQLKRNHDNKTQVDAHNAGYAKYGVGEYEELGRYLLKMYVPSSDVEYFKANQVREKAQKQVDDIINESSLNGAVFTGDISINLSNDYNPMSIAELAERLLGDNPSLSIMSNALSRSIDYANFSTGLARNPVNAVNDNSINISNVDVTLTQPIKSANDIINGFVDKINSTYATTKNQR